MSATAVQVEESILAFFKKYAFTPQGCIDVYVDIHDDVWVVDVQGKDWREKGWVRTEVEREGVGTMEG